MTEFKTLVGERGWDGADVILWLGHLNKPGESWPRSRPLLRSRMPRTDVT